MKNMRRKRNREFKKRFRDPFENFYASMNNANLQGEQNQEEGKV